jgi:hypothetical protein
MRARMERLWRHSRRAPGALAMTGIFSDSYFSYK